MGATVGVVRYSSVGIGNLNEAIYVRLEKIFLPEIRGPKGWLTALVGRYLASLGSRG